MKNQDLELAKLKLVKEDLSLVIVKNEKVIFETKKQGVNGFLQAIDQLNKELIGASVADKIIGVAAAMLCVYSGISFVFTLTVSKGGIKIFEENNILCTFQEKVSNILNRHKTDVCPFEKIAIESNNSEEAYMKLKFFAEQMSIKKRKTNC
ncbi:DUF1893 domain-containing protein [Candidatus Bathyarchaeota archaeon]|nr:DUF1893 domain-containing protein [Candidatus Bathyarchaeota archaeon]